MIRVLLSDKLGSSLDPISCTGIEIGTIVFMPGSPLEKERTMAMLKKGVSGEPVKRLQDKLGIEADGIFGSGTDKALRITRRKLGYPSMVLPVLTRLREWACMN